MQPIGLPRLLSAVVLLCILCGACPTHAARRCPPLFQLYGLNVNLLDQTEYLYDAGYQYFCADTAPLQYKCKCSVVNTCKAAPDPWGRNIGRCGCCPGWLIFVFVIPCIVVVILVIVVIYIYAMKPQWWCEGFPRAVYTIVPRRGPSVPCPPQLPLPDNVFRGYNSADFVNEEAAVPAAATATNGEANNGVAAGSNSNSVHATPRQTQ